MCTTCCLEQAIHSNLARLSLGQQMLRYEEGEYYRSHHDLIEHQIDRQEGVRIMTVYLYLNDLDEEAGGGTQFTNLGGLTVQPKRGRALLWPSVLDEDPHKKDVRTMHQAMPVIKGVKYGMLLSELKILGFYECPF